MKKEFLDDLINFCIGFSFDKEDLEPLDYNKIEEPVLKKIRIFKQELKKEKKNITQEQYLMAYLLLEKKEQDFYAKKISEDVLRTWSEVELEHRNAELQKNNSDLVTTDLSEYDFKVFVLNSNKKYFEEEAFVDLIDSLGITHKKQYIK